MDENIAFFYKCAECGLPWGQHEMAEIGRCPECGGHCVQDDGVYYEPVDSYDANDGTEGSY